VTGTPVAKVVQGERGNGRMATERAHEHESSHEHGPEAEPSEPGATEHER